MILQNHKGKKGRILSVATELFSRSPYHKVAMDTIAEKANVAKGTLYYHFSSKEELYASLLHEGLDNLLRRVNTQFTDRNAEEKMRALINELISFFHENREFFIVLQGEEAKLLTKKLRNCYEKICTIKDLLVNTIRQGVQEGLFVENGNPELLAEMVLGMIKAPVIRGKYDPAIHSGLILEFLFNGLKRR